MRLLLLAAMTAVLPVERVVAAAEPIPVALRARQLAREAAAPELASDPAERVRKFAAAVALMPEHPRYLLGLAAAQTAAGQPEAGVQALAQMAALGEFVDLAAIEPLAALREREDFAVVVARMAKLREPRGAGEVAFSLPAQQGLIEGIAWCERTGACFFGDVHLRAVWRRAPDGTMVRFDRGEGLPLAAFGLAIDQARGALWVALGALPPMRGYNPELKGRAGLAELDLGSGALRRVIFTPADGMDHLLGDLLVEADGTVFATDSAAGVVWRLGADGMELERWAESAEFLSLQGLAWSRDASALIVAAYGNGLLHIDRGTRAVTRIAAPAGATLLGIDGLEADPAGALVGIQNGMTPPRVLRLVLDDAGREVRQFLVLEAAHASMSDPTLLCRAGDELLMIGDAGWRFFEAGSAGPAVEPRSIPVLRVRSAGSGGR